MGPPLVRLWRDFLAVEQLYHNGELVSVSLGIVNCSSKWPRQLVQGFFWGTFVRKFPGVGATPKWQACSLLLDPGNLYMRTYPSFSGVAGQSRVNGPLLLNSGGEGEHFCAPGLPYSHCSNSLNLPLFACIVCIFLGTTSNTLWNKTTFIFNFFKLESYTSCCWQDVLRVGSFLLRSLGCLRVLFQRSPSLSLTVQLPLRCLEQVRGEGGTDTQQPPAHGIGK